MNRAPLPANRQKILNLNAEVIKYQRVKTSDVYLMQDREESEHPCYLLVFRPVAFKPIASLTIDVQPIEEEAGTEIYMFCFNHNSEFVDNWFYYTTVPETDLDLAFQKRNEHEISLFASNKYRQTLDLSLNIDDFNPRNVIMKAYLDSTKDENTEINQ